MILDLFAGPGGWDEALAQIGVSEKVIGIEIDGDACATAEAAGHSRIKADIRAVRPSDLAPCSGVIASPPCQTFSVAGKQSGMANLSAIKDALRAVAAGEEVPARVSEDARSDLVLEPMRFVHDLRPDWLVMEQVPTVLPVWEVYAEELSARGFSCWAGILNAADYGLPQKRRRAIFIGTKRGSARPPEPSHDEFPGETLFAQRKKWVTMAEALDLGSPRGDKADWAWRRPATTVVRSFRPEVISAPGYRGPGDGPRQNAPGSIIVTDEQMCILQGIRTDYPFAGSPTKRKSLIGAVFPPPLARPILESVLSQQLASVCCECGNDDAIHLGEFCSDCIEGATA